MAGTCYVSLPPELPQSHSPTTSAPSPPSNCPIEAMSFCPPAEFHDHNDFPKDVAPDPARHCSLVVISFIYAIPLFTLF